MKRITVLLVGFMLLGAAPSFAQNYDTYLKTAYQLLAEGNAEGANRNYVVYKKLTGKQDADFETLYAEMLKPKDWKDECWIIELGNGECLAVVKGTESNGSYSWESANSLAKNTRVGGFTDWRLPTVDELTTIVTQHKYGCDLWSSTLDIGHSKYTSLYYVIRASGSRDYVHNSYLRNYVAVRKFKK